MHCGLKQGKIILKLFLNKLIHWVAQCSKIIKTVLFLKPFFTFFCCFILVMSECPNVGFVA